MKLQDQVCTLGQAKRLKELGVSQDSLFYWSSLNSNTSKEIFLCRRKGMGLYYDEKGWFDALHFGPQCPEYTYSAFTVSELGVMLPRYYPSWRFLEEGGQEELWIVTVIGQPEGYERDKEDVMDIRTSCAFDRYGKTQAEALAALLISLLENNTEPAEEVNKRLVA